MKINDIIEDSGDRFRIVFLQEMPMRAPGINDFESQRMVLGENINNGGKVISISDNFHKMIIGNMCSYWVGHVDLTEVRMIVDTVLFNNICKVELTSKSPEYKTPYASDVYLMIVKDLGKSVAFTSDTSMSDEAIKLWKGMVDRGYSISVFDRDSDKYVVNAVTTLDELSCYIGGAENFKRYVFVLNESRTAYLSIRHSVSLMEIKRRMYGQSFMKIIGNT